MLGCPALIKIDMSVNPMETRKGECIFPSEKYFTLELFESERVAYKKCYMIFLSMLQKHSVWQ